MRILTFSASILLGLVFFPVHCPALAPDEIAILVNGDSKNSQAVADYYCTKRGVPTENIIVVPMSTQERIRRVAYDHDVALPVRNWLEAGDRKDQIRCILTVKGVPLRINPYVPQGEELKWRNLINNELDHRFGQLKQLTVDFRRFAEPGSGPAASGEDATFRLSRSPLKRKQTAVKMLQEMNEAARNAQQAMQTRRGRIGYEQKAREFEELARRMRGLEIVRQSLEQMVPLTLDEDNKVEMQGQLEAANQKIRETVQQVSAIDNEPLDVKKQKKKYEMILEVSGLQGLCQTLLNDRAAIDDSESDAAFDSELALIHWPPYRLSNQQPNRLYAHEEPPARRYPDPGHDEPTLMVARLDGPSLKIALDLVDRAIAAENRPLQGNAYIDARGIYADIDQPGSYGYYDEKVRRTADLIRRRTDIPVTENNQNALFGVGECPNTILYCGWWSVKKYIDSFTFLTGAVGYHIASFEAATLRDGGPESNLNNVWCKRMLEEGVTATLGAVNEPYLFTMPRPDLFFGDLLSGRYCLAECFYRSKPYNSWMLTLIGDPLYRPQFIGATAAADQAQPEKQTAAPEPRTQEPEEKPDGPPDSRPRPTFPRLPQKPKKPGGGFKPAF